MQFKDQVLFTLFNGDTVLNLFLLELPLPLQQRFKLFRRLKGYTATCALNDVSKIFSITLRTNFNLGHWTSPVC